MYIRNAVLSTVLILASITPVSNANVQICQIDWDCVNYYERKRLDFQVDESQSQTEDKYLIRINRFERDRLKLYGYTVWNCRNPWNALWSQCEEDDVFWVESEERSFSIPRYTEDELFEKCRETLKEAIQQEKLHAKIIGKAWRIKRDDLEDYIESL